MAVLQMDKIRICAVKKDRKKILEFLQRQGNVEVYDTNEADDVFVKADTSSSCAIFKKNAETAAAALAVLNHYCPQQTSPVDFLKGRKQVSVQEHDAFYDKRNSVLKTAQRIGYLQRSIDEANAEVIKAQAREEALTPWLELPVPQTFQGTKKTAVFIGSVDGEHTMGGLLEKLAAAAPELGPIHLEEVYHSKELTCFMLVASKRDADAAEAALRAIGFTRPATPSHHMPRKKQELLDKQKAEAQEVIRKAEEEIKSYEPLREQLTFLEDHMRMREEKYGVIEHLAQSRHVFVLGGYIAREDTPALERQLLEQFGCVVEIEPADEDENAPVKLKNSRFTEPSEAVIESYSMPSRNEIDPTPVMSIFYYVMFGLMFSDAGYGFIMAAVCGGLLLSFRNMEYHWKKSLRFFFWCGVSTVFWGVVFSSYFGDVVNVVAKTYFNSDYGIPPLWFAPLENPMKLLVFCLGIGVVHLTTGYIMKACNQFKSKQYIDILYDVGFPVAILFSLLLVLMGSDMFLGMAGFQVKLSPMAVNICLGIAVVSIFGVLLTGGRESRNWFKRLLKGLYALYNVLAGWLSDILSYSRLLALGLATGVIASVINSMGSMAGPSVVGVVVFAVVFVAGHALNFGINVLGAYVHSNRLEYVEFFGKFYEGGGRKFIPYGIHTKHYIIKEEI